MSIPDEKLARWAAMPRPGTPGPWFADEGQYDCDGNCSPVGCTGHGNGDYRILGPQSHGGDGADFGEPDATFIALAPEMREAVDVLVAEVRRLKSIIKGTSLIGGGR